MSETFISVLKVSRIGDQQNQPSRADNATAVYSDKGQGTRHFNKNSEGPTRDLFIF
jgi:hypothetical protein